MVVLEDTEISDNIADLTDSLLTTTEEDWSGDTAADTDVPGENVTDSHGHHSRVNTTLGIRGA